MNLPESREDLPAFLMANSRILVAQSHTLLAMWRVLKPQSAVLLCKSRQILARKEDA